MRVRKYVARTLTEAMGKVKSDMGGDAVILQTSQVRVGGLFGVFGRRMVQVTAAQDPNAVSVGALDRPRPVSMAQIPAAASAPATVLVSAPAVAPAAASLDEVKAEMADMKAMMAQVVGHMGAPRQTERFEPEVRELVTQLVDGGVEEEFSLSIARRVRTRVIKDKIPFSEAKACAHELISKDLERVQTVDFGRRIVALVGPTGVGKTTTLAKLAAHFGLQRRMRVSLITADTFRIAAVDQLRTYSEILGVPLEVVYDASEVSAALTRQSSSDLVLVDTAGRSPRNPAHMDELKGYLEAFSPHETYLVMSLTSAYRDATTIVDNYLPIGFDRLLFTKWDETSAPGLIYNIVRKYKRPLSYIATGQVVPDDIERANADKIARAILGMGL